MTETDPWRARLTALVAEMRERTLSPEIESDTEYWADRLAALLREPPENDPNHPRWDTVVDPSKAEGE